MKLEEIKHPYQGNRAFTYGDLKLLYTAIPCTLTISCEYRPPSPSEIDDIKSIFLLKHVKILEKWISDTCLNITQIASLQYSTVNE